MRVTIPDFALANPLYRGASVSFFTVANGVKTAILATIYDGPSGTGTLANPHKLDSKGKFRQPVYIETNVIATIDGISVPTHDTGIISGIAIRFRVNTTTGFLEYSLNGGTDWISTGDPAGHFVTLSDLSGSGGSALVGFTPSGTGGVTRDLQTVLREFAVSVKSFGAVGDGVTDDTAAIQAAIDSGATTIFFPRPSVTYRVTGSLNNGRWGWGGPGTNVTGFIGPTRTAMSFVGENTARPTSNATITWDGADQPGTTISVENDTVGPWNRVTDNAAVIHIVGTNSITFRNFSIKGNTGSNKAYACVWAEGFVTQFNFEQCQFTGGRIGIRNGTRVLYPSLVENYGYGGSPWYRANVNDYVAAGGYQGDTHIMGTCYLSGTIAGYSSESAQNLELVFNSGQIGGDVCGILCYGGWVNLNGVGFQQGPNGIPSQADVWSPSGGMLLSAENCHSESLATWNVRTSTTAAVPTITISGGDFGRVLLSGGGGMLSIIDCSQAKVQRNDVNSAASIAIANSPITGLTISNTGAQSNVRIALDNCDLSAGAILGTSGSESNCYLRAHNCTPIGNLPLFAGSLSTFADTFNGQSHEIKGRLQAVADGAAAATIATITNPSHSYSGYCSFRVFWTTGSGTAIAGVVGHYQFAWTVDSASNVTITAVRVIGEDKALDSIAAFAPVITAVNSGLAIQIKVAQTNTPAVAADAFLVGEVILSTYGQRASGTPL